MSLLLDSHVLLWWLAGAPLADDAADRIADERTLVMVSAATVWELAIKRAIGKLDLEGSITSIIVDAAFEPLDVSGEHAERAGGLPEHHHDPFDRMLIAQAQQEGLTIVTRERAFASYDVDLLAA